MLDKQILDQLEDMVKLLDNTPGRVLSFDVDTPHGPSKRVAHNYITGKAIIDHWKEKITGFTFECAPSKQFYYYKNGNQITEEEYEREILRDAESYGESAERARNVIAENKDLAKEDEQNIWTLFDMSELEIYYK